MANTWTSLLTRYGFELSQEGSLLNVSKLTNENRTYLEFLLQAGDVQFESLTSALNISEQVMSEERWQGIQGQFNDGRTEMSFFPKSLPIQMLDLFIAGLVVQLNRFGMSTVFSCDGHGKQIPHISFITGEIARSVHILLNQLDVTCHRRGRVLRIRINRQELPNLAETLSKLQLNQVNDIISTSDTRIKQKEFNHQLETLLNIPGASGKESKIRQYVLNNVSPYVDRITVDHYGNILAEKRFGAGPTVLINAHLDTVEAIDESRIIIKEKNVWTSSEGILGADDRAGINVIISILKSLKPNEFKGKLKVIFTVEEEIGLVGASEVSETFLWDVDMAFVIDRRGTNDIVSHNFSQEFCSREFGHSLERIARNSDLGNWKAVRGGSSDTAIWASKGIQSVNLSAGYLNEHSNLEQVDVDANYNAYLFLSEILENAQRLWSEQRRRLAQSN